MPRQPAHLNRRPYTKLPSALRKTELIRLCDEFNLPSDGSVVGLRDRIKEHLNQNRDDLLRNPCYAGLFPRPRRRTQRNRSSTPPTSSRTLSSQNHSSSPSHSYASWNGFENFSPDHVHPEQPPLIRQSSPTPSRSILETGFPPLTTKINDIRKCLPFSFF